MVATVLKWVSMLAAGAFVGDAATHPDAGISAIVGNILAALGLGGASFMLSKESVAQWLTWGRSKAHDLFDDSKLPEDMQQAANAAWALREVHPEAAANAWVGCWDKFASRPFVPEVADHA